METCDFPSCAKKANDWMLTEAKQKAAKAEDTREEINDKRIQTNKKRSHLQKHFIPFEQWLAVP